MSDEFAKDVENLLKDVFGEKPKPKSEKVVDNSHVLSGSTQLVNEKVFTSCKTEEEFIQRVNDMQEDCEKLTTATGQLLTSIRILDRSFEVLVEKYGVELPEEVKNELGYAAHMIEEAIRQVETLKNAEIRVIELSEQESARLIEDMKDKKGESNT